MDSPVEDKEWASKYLLDPLTAPEPNQETGPGSHFISPALASPNTSGSKVPASLRNSKASAGGSYPTPPGSASPSQSSFHPSNPYSSHRQSAFSAHSNNTISGGKGIEGAAVENGKTRRRGSSLGERFPGDMSHRPLDQLRKEAKAAHRSPHLRKRHLPGADIIDSLDRSMGTAYHHEGPYDATLMSRNMNYKNSPLEAVKDSNAEALRATPRENIRDALDKHVPLQGTANIPPGMAGLDGKPMHYEEGTDLMREPDGGGGPYKRWPGMDYHPEDYKGKGEPSFTIERALKESPHRRIMSDGNQAFEMQQPGEGPRPSRQPRSESPADLASRGVTRNVLQHPGIESEVRRSNTTGRQVGERIRRRLGSLRRSLRNSD